MRALDKIINQMQDIRLESLSIEILEKMANEIKEKQKILYSKAKKIKSSVDGIKIHQDFYGTSGILPDEFSTPLKKIITKQREMRKIDKYNQRYKLELRRIDDIINQKRLQQKMENKLGNSKRVLIKDSIFIFLIIFVLTLLMIELLNPELSEDTLFVMFLADVFCCFLFQINFFMELKYSSSKKWYLRNHWLDFVTSIPIPNAGILRLGRIVRLVRLGKLFRFLRFAKIFRLIFFFWKGLNELEDVFDVGLAKKSLLYTFIVTISGAMFILYLEGSNESGITSIMESLWWSIYTIVYGSSDLHTANTDFGRILTLILMIFGMILIGILTATLTTILVRDESDASIDTLRIFMDKRLTDIDSKIDK